MSTGEGIPIDVVLSNTALQIVRSKRSLSSRLCRLSDPGSIFYDQCFSNVETTKGTMFQI